MTAQENSMSDEMRRFFSHLAATDWDFLNLMVNRIKNYGNCSPEDIKKINTILQDDVSVLLEKTLFAEAGKQ